MPVKTPRSKKAKSPRRRVRKARGGAPDDPMFELPTESVSNPLGKNIGLNKTSDLREQLDSFKDSFIDTMGKQRLTIDKFRALQGLNKQLSESYFKNLTLITDISRLLNSYVEFLEIVKAQTRQISSDIDRLGPQDFDYIKNLTTEKIFALADEFKKSASDLKTLYSTYNMKQEYEQVEIAEAQMQLLEQEADGAWSKLGKDTNASFMPAPRLEVPEEKKPNAPRASNSGNSRDNDAKTNSGPARENDGPSAKPNNNQPKQQQQQQQRTPYQQINKPPMKPGAPAQPAKNSNNNNNQRKPQRPLQPIKFGKPSAAPKAA